MRTITTSLKTIRVMNAQAAGIADRDSSVVDMSGYHSVRFLLAFGTLTAGAVTTISFRHGSLADGSDAAVASVTVANVPDTEDNKLYIIEIVRPILRYGRVRISNTTQNIVVDGVVCELGGPRIVGTTDDATTVPYRRIYASPQ